MRTFGHSRPVRDNNGNAISSKPSPLRAVTVNKLGGSFGLDHNKRLIVTLDAGDLIILRPERTTRPVAVAAKDVYRFALMCKANLANLEKARAAKARRAERLAARRIAAAERRLFPKPRHTPGNGEPMIGANWRNQ